MCLVTLSCFHNIVLPTPFLSWAKTFNIRASIHVAYWQFYSNNKMQIVLFFINQCLFFKRRMLNWYLQNRKIWVSVLMKTAMLIGKLIIKCNIKILMLLIVKMYIHNLTASREPLYLLNKIFIYTRFVM